MTILLITPHTIARADFRGRQPRLVDLWQESAPRTDSLSMLAEAAWHLGPRRGKQIWVLSSTVWTDTLSLPDTGGSRLTDSEVSQALRFEAESLSGISGAHSSVAHRLLDNQECLVSQIEHRRMAELRELFGKRFAGLLHPAALPVSWPDQGTTQGNGWERIEIWPGLSLRLSGEGEHLKSAQNQLAQVPGDSPSCPVLDFTGTGAVAHAIDCMEQEKAQDYLEQWAGCLRRGLPEHMVLTPLPLPVSPHRKTVIAMILALLVGIGCYAHWTTVRAKEQQLRQQITQAQRTKQAFDKSKLEVEKGRKQLEALRSTEQKLRHSQGWREQALTDQGARTTGLLSALSAVSPADLLIQSVRISGPQAVISGLAVKVEAPNQMGLALQAHPEAAFWRVAPPQKSLYTVHPRKPVWQFTLEATIDIRQKASTTP